jgi:signal transduction histidine kinase
LNEQQATLTLEDDGVGFSVSSHSAEGFGLRGVRERLELVGGQLIIRASPQSGTQLHASIPYTSSEAKGRQHG